MVLNGLGVRPHGLSAAYGLIESSSLLESLHFLLLVLDDSGHRPSALVDSALWLRNPLLLLLILPVGLAES